MYLYRRIIFFSTYIHIITAPGKHYLYKKIRTEANAIKNIIEIRYATKRRGCGDRGVRKKPKLGEGKI